MKQCITRKDFAGQYDFLVEPIVDKIQDGSECASYNTDGVLANDHHRCNGDKDKTRTFSYKIPQYSCLETVKPADSKSCAKRKRLIPALQPAEGTLSTTKASSSTMDSCNIDRRRRQKNLTDGSASIIIDEFDFGLGGDARAWDDRVVKEQKKYATNQLIPTGIVEKATEPTLENKQNQGKMSYHGGASAEEINQRWGDPETIIQDLDDYD